MPTIDLITDSDDDPAFVRLVNQIIEGAVETYRPTEVRVFKIDHWFDHKWLAFSGKVLGALGIWKNRLTIPPFVANRIVNQLQYMRDDESGSYNLTGEGPDIHHRGRSQDNFQRTVKQNTPNTALFWYSGATLNAGRGSLMGYIPVDDDVWPWFLTFVRSDGWRITRRKSIHEYELRKFQAAGEEPTVVTIEDESNANN